MSSILNFTVSSVDLTARSSANFKMNRLKIYFVGALCCACGLRFDSVAANSCFATIKTLQSAYHPRKMPIATVILRSCIISVTRSRSHNSKLILLQFVPASLIFIYMCSITACHQLFESELVIYWCIFVVVSTSN